ncbi:hypothetical protein BD413DRAFT_491279 [Trametes elegans]|nr:hypothetical protein BD413DRAFT_491279 [Trametes elegans]
MLLASHYVHKLSLAQPLGLSLFLRSTRLYAKAIRIVELDDTCADAVTGAIPTYTPSADWARGVSLRAGGDRCLVSVDPNSATHGTWHISACTPADADSTIDLSFSGSSVSVHCIIREADGMDNTVASMPFELDGQGAGTFVHGPALSGPASESHAPDDYESRYDVQMFSASPPTGKHTLRIRSAGSSRVMFDHASYTRPGSDGVGSAASASLEYSASIYEADGAVAIKVLYRRDSAFQPNLGVIVVVTVAGLAAIAAWLYLFIRRRRNSKAVHPANGSLPTRGRLSPGNPHVNATGLASNSAFSAESLCPEHLAASNLPYARSTHSHLQLDLDGDVERQSIHSSLSDAAVPLLYFAAHAPQEERSESRIVVFGTETRLEGPDNSMARIARQRMAGREAELVLRSVHDVKAALPHSDAKPTGADSTTSTSDNAPQCLLPASCSDAAPGVV